MALMEVLDEEELKSGSVTEDGVTYTATVAQPRTTVSYDEDGLKKALGAKTYASITTSRLDKTKLEQAVTDGKVDVQVVAQHTAINHGARSVRLTRKVAEPSDSPTA